MSGPPQNTEDMSIMLGRRLTRERERLIGMTDEERAWRAKFLKDQILDPSEPVIPLDYNKKRYNIFRRIYRAPLNKFENMLVPVMGPTWANGIRHIIAKGIMGTITIYGLWYYMKYNRHSWEKPGSWKATVSLIKQFPSDPGFPNTESMLHKGNQFATYGFEKSPI